jgi:hypothetical protein
VYLIVGGQAEQGRQDGRIVGRPGGLHNPGQVAAMQAVDQLARRRRIRAAFAQRSNDELRQLTDIVVVVRMRSRILFSVQPAVQVQFGEKDKGEGAVVAVRQLADLGVDVHQLMPVVRPYLRTKILNRI